METKYKGSPILVTAHGKLASSVTVCLLLAGHPVTLMTEDKEEAIDSINSHFAHLSELNGKSLSPDMLEIEGLLDRQAAGHKIGIAITDEDEAVKRTAIRQLERLLFPGSIIAINTESIPLSLLQEGCECPERLIGLNWAEPAHTTFFLEIITNAGTRKKLADSLYELARDHWNKDPYFVSGEVGIRAKMLSGMIREAFYLVQNGYATIEDIDRACRNDAGYYLPFAGNFRYMDLMGTYAYGLVMKDLNRELSKEARVPRFFEEIIEQGGLGMQNNRGFYPYEPGEAERWNELFSLFSYQIRQIIEKNPFNRLNKPTGNYQV
ncbi:MAG TPA: 3-hydroxyacyl-CoA dehydrogenase NAD-binding domain-containing protein [Puia sp.]|nr:3-hydroxyacyl-CoA dehydrogenase NAD-binding domain-containing protein [Puia sp.]